jgi:DNA-binding helix-hairpin-helix protein with protein kinase domain
VPPTRTLYDQQGRALELGPPLASGGEGVVFPLEKEPGLLAKIYHQAPAGQKVEKLRWMARAASPELCRFAAWPTATLHDTPGGPLVGFLMPRFQGGRPIHTLYSPAHRRTTFPSADWSFLIHAAMNCASAFDALHSQGPVIGDVNQSNVLVSDQAMVCLIDCDSFQVRSSEQLYLCEVGVGQYTPSELQGHNLRTTPRTVNHDRFGLAVLIFHLLFMGRHPFAGRFLGDGEMPLERAIKEYRFVYSEADPATRMAAPPFALPLRTVSGDLARLFERAFNRGAEQDGYRPTAAEWHTALVSFRTQLRSCAQVPGHKIPAHLTECPWCSVVKAGGPNFFLGVAQTASVFTVDRQVVLGLWARIQHVPFHKHKLVEPKLPDDFRMVPKLAPRKARWALQNTPRSNALGCLVTLVGFIVVWWVYNWLAAFGVLVAFFCLNFIRTRWKGAYLSELRLREKALELALEAFQSRVLERHQAVQRYKAEFPRLKTEMQKVRDRYLALQAEYEAERPKLPRPREGASQDPLREARAREYYLKSCFLSDHKVPGIGPGRVVILASYGIETAFEVTEDQLLTVRGIGPVLRKNLLKWRQDMLKAYHYDPGTTPGEAEKDPQAIALVLKYQQIEEGLRGRLQKGAVELEALSGHYLEEMRDIQTRLQGAYVQAVQAEVDLIGLNGNVPGDK